jgi:tetratricopeptide (TPR) repeat protein
MSASNPDQTVDLSPATRVELARRRYDEAWKQAVLTDGPAPERESFLTEVGDESEDLAPQLTLIDGAYSRINELLKCGVVTLGPQTSRNIVLSSPELSSGTAIDSSQKQSGVVSQFAETLDADAAGRAPEPPADGGSQYAETIDSSPVGEAAQSSPIDSAATIGNYELLGVIAQGGMGVVFKARHVRLDRLAAIKMVLAGAHATPDQLARFQSEAQAIARLQHPNIVQLYEVGEHDSLPYIALEFVDGGSLAQKTGSKPQPPREAAEQVERLARSMHFAHQNGIVHRDLKPANILLTADGIPKVTDFGLAKRLEADSGQTRTGTLMGTPSFMAPEQARGDNKAVGPLTDVYSLGAILYHQLTGRPPFAAGSAMETVVAVLKTEPVAPSRLQATTPRDLETICLKCLQKEPQHRYASAAELADDLQRFLVGEPIRARPISVAERLWRWSRRNPGIATLSAAVFLLLTTVAVGSTIAAVRIGAEKRHADENASIAQRSQEEAVQALREVERQKQSAEASAVSARTAQKEAETAKAATEQSLKNTEKARAEAVAARKVADQMATVASDQTGLALDAIGGIVTNVLDRLDDSESSQRVKKELLELALGRLKKITGTVEQTAVVDMRMADAHRRLGDLARRLGDIPLARRNYMQAGWIIRKKLATNPDDPDWKRSLSVAEVISGDLALETGDRVASRKHYEAARDIRFEIAAADGGTRPSKVDLAQTCIKLGDVSDPERAIKFYREALETRESILEGNPGDPNARRDVGLAHYKIADGYRRHRAPADGKKHAERAVDIAQGLVDDYPTLPALKQQLSLSLMKLGDLLEMLEQGPAAAEKYELALRTLRPQVTQNQKDLVLQLTYALFLARAGKHGEATDRAGRVCAASPKNPFLLYNAACVYALAAARTVSKSGTKPTAEEEKVAAGYREAALKQLRAAISAGFADQEQIRSSTELDSIRQLPEFAEIVKSFN